jgi:hypothetical protein
VDFVGDPIITLLVRDLQILGGLRGWLMTRRPFLFTDDFRGFSPSMKAG